MKLLKMRYDYADEFDTYGCLVVTDENYELFLEIINTKDIYPFEVYFGTNEYLEIESSHDIISGISVEDITEEEATTLKKFGFNDYDMTNVYHKVWDKIAGEDDE